ncbi:MAG: hypothetical protein HP007_11865 [Bacteroides sp.]|jgi:hypothetical protein|nr:hypothetical protein [Bacteroides sp.]
MKTLRFIGMAVLAVVMSVNFTSCSDDDEPGSENPIGGKNKRLVQDMEQEDPNDISYYHYNADGWLEEVTKSDNESVKYSYSTKNGKTYVKGTWEDGQIESETVIENDLIKTIDGIECLYDAENRLIQCGNAKFTWENGNVTKVEIGGSTYLYTYDADKVNKYSIGSDPIVEHFDNYFVSAHPYLLGQYCKNLVKSTIYKNGYNDEIDNYSYQIDGDGYVLSYKSDRWEENIFDYKWE